MKALKSLSRPAQAGFTLIELVMVMVIIAILAAVAIPKFVDLSSQAKTAALAGVQGALNSAAAVNYAARKAGDTTNTTAIAVCDDTKKALQGGLPAGFTIGGTAPACTVTDGATTVNFTTIVIP
jgi:MSHA pilin protein MshA